MQKKCGNCAFLEKNLARIATERPDERSEGGFAVRAGLTRKCAPNFQEFLPGFLLNFAQQISSNNKK